MYLGSYYFASAPLGGQHVEIDPIGQRLPSIAQPVPTHDIALDEVTRVNEPPCEAEDLDFHSSDIRALGREANCARLLSNRMGDSNALESSAWGKGA